jgi:predicted nicotinamide N-methyase
VSDAPPLSLSGGLESRIAFIRANTRTAAVAGLEPLQIWTADELTPIWEATEADLAKVNVAPPFWAFPWAGGQAVSRWLLDNPQSVAGKRVLDLACGSGLCALAAARAGAAQVFANDIDPICEAAMAANAELNGVAVDWLGGDLLDAATPDVDVVLAGDVFYEQQMAKRFLACFRRAAEAGVQVIVGDPGRMYFPREAFTLLAEYDVVTTMEIENNPVKTARVWKL